MSKKPVKKAAVVAEAIFWAAFVVSTGLAALSLLNFNAAVLSETARAVVGYVVGAYAALAFGYLVYRAVENRAE